MSLTPSALPAIQPDKRQHLVHTCTRLARRDGFQHERQFDIFGSVQHRQKIVELKDDPRAAGAPGRALSHLDSDGFVHFVGWMDEVIKVKGEKVAPKEVEEALRLWCKRHLEPVAVPHRIDIVEAFRLTPNGKIDRKQFAGALSDDDAAAKQPSMT